jgi:serine/threonine protein kinase
MNVQVCNDDRLQILLSTDEDSAEFRAAAAHLETCANCQRRLTTLAGDDDLWKETHHLLDCDEPRWTPENSEFGSRNADSNLHSAIPSPQSEIDSIAIRQLLSAPNHPEMLGRLGRYDIERVIGRGGMGIVLKAHDSELNRPIAIKVLAAHLAHVGAARERFAREGRAAAAVVHEHVVAIYNVETDGEMPFLVMQYVPGRSLQTRVDEDGPLGVEQILRIGVQAAAGLAAAHRQGLVHRDVKPSNILLEDTVERAILTDFGLARAMDDASLTQTGIVAGTPHYMSPEQASGGPIDHRSDLFSLGSVLYFMATGRPPFRATGSLAVLHRICREAHRPAWEVNAEIPDELCDVINRLLEKKPGRRFASAEEVGQRMAELLSRAQQRGLGRRPFRALRIRRMWKSRRAAVAAVVILAILAIVAGVLQNGREDSPQPNATEIASSPVAPESPAPAADPFAAEQLRQIEADQQSFDAELNALRAAAAGATTETLFLQGGEDTWARELDALERELSSLESDSDDRSQ